MRVILLGLIIHGCALNIPSRQAYWITPKEIKEWKWEHTFSPLHECFDGSRECMRLTAVT